MLVLVLTTLVIVPAGSTAANRLDRAVLRLVNQERDRHGLNPLRLRPALTRVATSHTRYLKRIGHLQHESADGTPATTRIHRAMSLRIVGETLAYAATARALVEEWMQSAPHRELLLSRSFRWAGVGVVPGTLDGYDVLWSTVDLGR